MPKLNARTDNFISLLLHVSGKARPSDIQGVDQATAIESLRGYAEAHPEMGLVFDGETLAAGVAQVSAAVAEPAFRDAPAPESPAPATAAGESFEFEFGPADPMPSVPHVEAVQAVAPPAADIAPEPLIPAPTSDFLDLPPLEGVGDASDVKRKKSPLLMMVLLLVLIAVAAVAALGYIGIIPIPGLTP